MNIYQSIYYYKEIEEEMRVIVFEGTSDEFKAVAPYLGGQGPEGGPVSSAISPISPIPPQPAEVATNDKQQLKEKRKEAIRFAINRKALSEKTIKLFQVLSEGEIRYDQLVEKLNFGTNNELTGVIGSLGRRMSGTPEIQQAELPGNVYAVIPYRRDRGALYLRLRQEAYEVLKEENYIK